jgi:hypothetical protein
MMSAKLIDSKDPFKLIVVDVRFFFKIYFKVNSKEFISICQDTFAFFQQFSFFIAKFMSKILAQRHKAQKTPKNFFSQQLKESKIHRQLFRTRRRRLRVASCELRVKNALVSLFNRNSLRFYPVNPQPVTRNRFSLFFDGGFWES